MTAMYKIGGDGIPGMKIFYAYSHEMGVSGKGTEYCFTVFSKSSYLKIHLYSDDECKKATTIELDESFKRGSVFAVRVVGVELAGLKYLFEDENGIFCDPYTKKCFQREGVCGDEYVGIIVEDTTQDDYCPRPMIPANELVMYKIHVKGFTKDRFSKVKNKGTYRGVVEKIPYLVDLGINAVELMPAYEFYDNGIMKNYWGYAEGLYFTPKTAYCATKDCIAEFSEMVQELHKNNIDVYMEFFFPEKIMTSTIVQCLRYWHEFYHIDGFHVICDGDKAEQISGDFFLTDARLFRSNWNAREDRGNLVEYNDGFLEVARHMLKGDEDMLSKFLYAMRKNPAQGGVVNYIANNNGFTLNDVFSYDRKHNEENGEGNRDGVDYNLSWNCGVEGVTKKKKINELRNLLAQNAMVMLMTAQGIPLIYSGDEFLNSQNGNNNAYCQDNETGWVNWNQLNRNIKFHDFVKKMIAFRKAHGALHMTNEPYLMDYKYVGQPDVSYHSSKAWYPDLENYNRHVGILTCGSYNDEDEDVYVVFNMHWEPHELALPGIRGKYWEVYLSTGKMPDNPESTDKSIEVDARTAVVLLCKKNS